ncbi:ABC transporter ATP-binding protein [Enterococcus faecium]|uniref:ABC transporter ATP-binding protein n=1 Tax=Enterococcus faecium TaxID=1352 RepID=UPI000937C29B|nr:ABC transporter ATP-binding protein [Enterococcus faecium]QUM65610.1 ABC transporter ATP-binding protein [Enterococcus faecium]
MKKNVLDIKDLSLKYGKKFAIKDINLSIFTGEIVALVGHNGAGKSSLFNIIAGVQTPTTGSVEFDQDFIEKRLFATIGFSPQTQVMDWYTNVWDNVYLGSQLAGIDTKTGKLLTEKALDLLSISDLKNKPVDALSGGQQQRVQIARSIVHQPDFYLLDEPTTGLDAETSNRLLSFLKKEAAKGKSVFVSSHDLHLLEEFCDNLVLIDKGRVLYAGDLKNFLIENAPKKSYKITTDRSIDEEIIHKLNEKGIAVTGLDNFQYRFILNQESDLTQLFMDTKEFFRIDEIVKETMSLRDLYIHYREGGL